MEDSKGKVLWILYMVTNLILIAEEKIKRQIL